MRAKYFLAAAATAILLFASYNNGRAADAAQAIDASLAVPEDFFAIVIHPRRIAESPLVAEQLKDEAIAGAIKKAGIAPGDIEQVVVFFAVDPTAGIGGKPLPTVLVRFNKAVDLKEMLQKMDQAFSPQSQNKAKEIEFAGKTAYTTGGDGVFYAQDAKTVVLGNKDVLQRIIAGGGGKGPIFDRLQKAVAASDVVIVVAPEAYANLNTVIDVIKQGAPPMLLSYLDAAKTVRGVTANFSLDAPPLLRVAFDTKDAESAANVEELVSGALKMASGGLVLGKQSIPAEQKATLGPILKLADEIIDGAAATKNGSVVILEVKRPKILDSAGASIITSVKQSVMSARSAARRTHQSNNMRQIALAMVIHENAKQSYPPAAIAKDGKPLLSWRVAILPYIEDSALYEKFHLDEPWDSPHNMELAKTMPAVFQSADGPNDGKTRIMLFTGKGAAFDGDKKVRAADIRDGMSHTILCVEAAPDKAVPWTKPEDLPFDPQNPTAALGTISEKGILAAFFDGSVQTLKVDNDTLKALITPDGGETIDMSKVYGGR